MFVTVEHEKVLPIDRNQAAAMRVLIVGRDPLTGNLLAQGLAHNLSCDAVVVSCCSLLQFLKTQKASVAIVSADLGLKSETGFDLVKSVSGAHPGLPMILLLNELSHNDVIRAFRSGASGVFSPQEPMSELERCIEHVAKGCIWAGKKATASLLEAFKSIPAPSTLTGSDSSALTARELQVVQCAARGKTNKAIARELCLSEHTVKNYLFRAFEKLGVSSRVELLFYLTIHGHSFGPSREDLEQSPAEQTAHFNERSS